MKRERSCRGPVTRSALFLLSAVALFGASCASLSRQATGRFDRYVPAGGGQAPSTDGWAEPTGVGSVSAATNEAATALADHRLRSGDRITILLRGIPTPSEVVDQVDEKGCVNLEFVGTVAIGGLTTSEAERRIERAYVEGDIYRRINVTVVAESEEYFVRGEVRQPGRFPLSRGMTLTQAIAAAGGYTDFARPTKVRIIRGEQVILVDATRIEKRQDADVTIKRNDTIVIERSPI
jgi:polysaccharide export outer membrane protein